MPAIAPVVFSATAGGAVYLLEWQQLAEGSWGALVAYMEWNGLKWQGRRRQVMAENITPIEGQDYSRVPRKLKG
ncbi:hypothetical protein [Actinomadura rubrisoli]|uniref:Uncharacterized protein n=1 Tax=Actinomadura rubrisoli TaxID=2530368 RepID=A0A4R5C402_9ACTN|nr:hypothetical protein [Actinomadura rubrisoli]TDD93319.1 hypothetical protein E1298_10050 [Actinomadura rubrisoli]